MTTTAHVGATRDPLSEEVIARTRSSLAQIYTASRVADALHDHCRNLPLVKMIMENGDYAADAPPRGSSSRAARAAAVELLALPPDSWRASIAALAPPVQRGTVRRLITAADTHVPTAPDRALRFADTIVAAIRGARLPAEAPVLRRHLAARALLARARALIALQDYAGALPAIADAYHTRPRTPTSARYRIDAEILRGRALAATGHPAEALEMLIIGARRAVEHYKPLLAVDALTALAILLSAHAEYALARSALKLAARIAARPGNASAVPALHAALAECAFLGCPTLRAE
jgi:tetratricopeptide (TPR) repeat protein